MKLPVKDVKIPLVLWVVYLVSSFLDKSDKLEDLCARYVRKRQKIHRQLEIKKTGRIAADLAKL